MQVRTAWLQCIPLSCFLGWLSGQMILPGKNSSSMPLSYLQNEKFGSAIKGTQAVCVANLNPF